MHVFDIFKVSRKGNLIMEVTSTIFSNHTGLKKGRKEKSMLYLITDDIFIDTLTMVASIQLEKKKFVPKIIY